MVTVDDATYVAMRDNLYKWDAWAASRAKAKIESSYSQQQYDTFLSQLNGMSWSTPKTTTTTTTRTTPQDTSRDQWSGNYVYNPSTWYYEKEWTARATQTTPTTPTTKQETSTKQQETIGTTTNEIKQQGAMKPLSQEYYNQTNDVALNQIRDNLNRYKQSNPEYFVNYDTFKNNFSYDARNDEQKKLLDDWYKWYQDGLTLASTPITDLYTQYQNWSISSEQLEQLRVSDPTKYSELMNQINTWNIIAAYDDDKWMDFTWNSIQEMAYQAAQQMFMQWMSGDSSSWASQYFREYEEKMESPEMKWLSDKTTELQEQIENIQDDIASMQKAVEKEYEWTWASRAKISAIVADRTYDLQLQLRTANSEYNKYATQYNNRMQQYQNEFQLQLQEYQINQQARQQQMQELWFAMDLMSFETPQQAQEREWNYWVKQQEYQNWNINSKDYQTRYKAALNSVQNLLSQYEWIPMVRSAEEMAQDILTAIDGGSNLWAELTKINKQIQAKPEYKYLYNNTYNPSAWGSNSWFGKTIKVGDMEFVEYNGGWYTAEQIKEMFKWGQTWSAKPYEVVDESAFSMNVAPQTIWEDGSWQATGKNLWKFLMTKAKGTKWWQCGKFVNDYLEYIWMTWAKNRYYDDNLSTKLNSINSYDPKVWTIAVFDYNHKSSDGINHGHVGIVTKVTNDWVWVRDSNYWSDEKIQERFIPKDSTEWNNDLKWFFDPSRPPIWSEISVEEASVTSNNNLKSQLSTQDKQKAEAMLKQIKSWAMTPSDTSAARDWLIENWYGEEFNEALDKWLKVALTDTQQKQKTETLNRFNNSSTVKDFKDASVQISNLITALNANNWAWDLAWIFQFMKVLDPSSVVREWEFKNAAASAWYANPEALWQKYLKHWWDGTWLTEAQRWNFWELAKSIIKSQAEFYNLEYDQVKQDFDNSWIDQQWLPINYADYIINKLDEWNMVTSSNSFKNMTLPTVRMKNLTVTQPTVSTKSVLQSKYWLM